MLSRSGRPLGEFLFGPIARGLVKIGVSANTVTVVGGLLSVFGRVKASKALK